MIGRKTRTYGCVRTLYANFVVVVVAINACELQNEMPRGGAVVRELQRGGIKVDNLHYLYTYLRIRSIHDECTTYFIGDLTSKSSVIKFRNIRIRI